MKGMLLPKIMVGARRGHGGCLSSVRLLSCSSGTRQTMIVFSLLLQKKSVEENFVRRCHELDLVKSASKGERTDRLGIK